MKEEKSKDTRRRRRKKSIANLKLVLSLRLTATLIFESTRARKKQVSNFLESSLQKKERKFSKCQTWNSYPRGRTGFERDWREEEEEGSRINHRVSVGMFALFPVEGEKIGRNSGGDE